jgi:hypothetical protein
MGWAEAVAQKPCWHSKQPRNLEKRQHEAGNTEHLVTFGTDDLCRHTTLSDGLKSLNDASG